MAPALLVLLAACGSSSGNGNDTGVSSSPPPILRTDLTAEQMVSNAGTAPLDSPTRAPEDPALLTTVTSEQTTESGRTAEPGQSAESQQSAAAEDTLARSEALPDTETPAPLDTTTSGSTTGVTESVAAPRRQNHPDCLFPYYDIPESPAAPLAQPDPSFNEQWYLQNTGSIPGTLAGEDINVVGAWALAKGEGIRVAVVDYDIEVLHRDLRDNVVPGASYNYGIHGRGNSLPLPCTSSSSHGTAVAGLIAARDNNGIGTRGVAPRVGLVAYNPLRDDAQDSTLPIEGKSEHDDLLDALGRDLDKNHIYNNSWSHADEFAFDALGRFTDDFRRVIERGLRDGRQGLGNIFVFAAGNEGDCPPNTDGVCRPRLSNYENTLTPQGILGICATSALGKRQPYSQPGSNLLVCAPSGDLPRTLATTPFRSITTGIHNSLIQNFGGTSAAAPLVSGVVALMLQTNPQLSWRDVPLILAHTARQVDPESPSWTRFGTLNYSHYYGFGVVDAEAAVRRAATWVSVGGSDTQLSCGPYSFAGEHPIPALPEGSSVQMLDPRQSTEGFLQTRIDIPADCAIQQIERVELQMQGISVANGEISFSMAGQERLQILLTSPAGQTSVLATPHTCSSSRYDAQTRNWTQQPSACQNGLNDFRFGLTRHMDEPARTADNPAWVLSLSQRIATPVANAARATGEAPPAAAPPELRLQSWHLQLYGR